MRILVTGGCGFIGSAVVRHLMRGTDHVVVNVDKMTYAASEDALEEARGAPPPRPGPRRHRRRAPRMRAVFAAHQPDAVMHLAAETHVDRSIDGPATSSRPMWSAPSPCSRRRAATGSACRRARARAFRFHHISTDEVFGSLGADDAPFTETTPYDPSSPYSASKAASDHLVRAWHHTYGLPMMVTNCSNNYGPWQFPEKLIPLITLNALEGKPLPVYGDGAQCARLALCRRPRRGAGARCWSAASPARPTTSAARQPRSNIDVVRTICAISTSALPDPGRPARAADPLRRPTGRATISATRSTRSRTEAALGWRAPHDFETGLRAHGRLVSRQPRLVGADPRPARYAGAAARAPASASA